MRVVMEAQRSFGQFPIEEIKFDGRSRDDIPAILRGLRSIYLDAKTRLRVFEILEEGVASGVSHKLGRRGMDLWRIFVLGVVKQALNCDYDRLTHMANYDNLLRQMLGHGGWEEGPIQSSLPCPDDHRQCGFTFGGGTGEDQRGSGVAWARKTYEEGAAGGVAVQGRFRGDEDACTLAYGCQSAQGCGDLFASGDCASVPFARDTGLAEGGQLGRAAL